MEINRVLDIFPLWALLPITIAILALSIEVGFRVAGYRQKHSRDEPPASVGPVVAPILGLLAFMLAFTFGMAGSRFEARRQVVLTEANAIGTTYLRAGLLPEPMRTEVQGLLRQYVDTRLEGTNQEKLTSALARSDELLKLLWLQGVAASEKERTPMTSLFLTSLNQVIEVSATRTMAAIRSRIPGTIWIALYTVAMIAMGTVGYSSRLTSPKRSLVLSALVLVFSVVLVLIADLDRPGQ